MDTVPLGTVATTRVGDATWTFGQTEREPIELQNIFIWKKFNIIDAFVFNMKFTKFEHIMHSENLIVLDIFFNNKMFGSSSV